MSTLTRTRKPDRFIAFAERATDALNVWLESGKRSDKREAEWAYDDLIEACPTSLEGVAAIVSYLSFRQEALLEPGDEPRLRSAFRSQVDTYIFIQCLDTALQRMLARRERQSTDPIPFLRGPLYQVIDPEECVRAIEGQADALELMDAE